MKAFVLAISLVSVSAVSAMADGPLRAGEPAGVRQAQLDGGNGMIVLAGAAAIGMGILLATTTTTTTTTG